MNALVGTAAPGEFGGDVSHLNLHKTFCIPHGGGGPGRRPRVRGGRPGALSYRVTSTGGRGLVKWAPSRRHHWAMRRCLPISWMYMPHDGRRRPAPTPPRLPILSRQLHQRAPEADHVSHAVRQRQRKRQAGPCGARMHSGPSRHFKESCGVMAEDVAKRLMDYGFHAPTLSFPVPNTLDGGAHRERAAGRARPLHRRHDRHPRGDPPHRGRRLAQGRQPAQARPAHRRQPAGQRVDAPLLTRTRRLSAGRTQTGQVLAAGGARGQRVRGPKPVLQLRAGGDYAAA